MVYETQNNQQDLIELNKGIKLTFLSNQNINQIFVPIRLKNPNNLCYFNSVIHSLASNQYLVYYLQEIDDILHMVDQTK